MCLCTPRVPDTDPSVRSLGTGVIDGCAPTCVFWRNKLGPLEEQRVLVTTEPSLRPQVSDF